MNVSLDPLQRVPLVSIAIAAYNRGHLIGRTIDSLLRQTVRDFELVITDDSTDDGTRELCSGSFPVPLLKGQMIDLDQILERTAPAVLGL